MRTICKSVLAVLGALVLVAGCDSKEKQTSEKTDPGTFLRDGVEAPKTDFVPVRESAPKESWADDIDTSTAPKSTGGRGTRGSGGVSNVGTAGGEPPHLEADAPRLDAEKLSGEERRKREEVRESTVVGHPGSHGLDPIDDPFAAEEPSSDEKREVKTRKKRRRLTIKPTSKKDKDSTISLWGDHEPSEPSRGGSSDSKIQEASESVSKEVVFGPSPAERRQREQRAKREKARERRAEQLRKQVIEEMEREAERLEREKAPEKRTPPASTTSTFSMDVDTGSYTLAGRMLARGIVPAADEVRAEEFINFFEYDYPEPKGAFGLTVEGAPSPFRRQGRHVLVKFGVEARELTAAETNATKHVTVLVDVSRSMRDADALPVVEQSIGTLIGELDDSDALSLVVYDSEPRLLLNSVPVSETEQLFDGIARLEADGPSGLQEGLAFAYEHANRQRSTETQSNVIVFSDGAANIGARRGRVLAREVSETKAEDVGLTVLGVGDTDYNDDLLEQLADRGDGAYYHVNALPEAERLFGPKLDALLHTVARDAKIQVEFDPDKVASFRRIGYENRALPDEFFRRDHVDAAEIGPGQSVTALFEIELAEGASGRLGKLSVRFNEPGGEDGKELAAEFRAEDVSERFASASDDLRFAAAIAGFAEILERTELGRALDIDRLVAVAESATKDREHRDNAVYLMRRLIELAG